MEPLKKVDNSIDYVFAKFWTPVQNGAQILLPVDRECIAKKIESAKWPEGKETKCKTFYCLFADFFGSLRQIWAIYSWPGVRFLILQLPSWLHVIR